MKLNAKFSCLILGLIVVVLAINITVINLFNQFLDVKNYERTIKETITSVNKLGSYNDAIFTRRFYLQNVSSDWKELLAKTDELIDYLQTAPVLASLPKDINKNLSFGSEIWLNSYFVFGNLTQQYDRLAAQKLADNLKLYVETNGLQEGLYLAQAQGFDTNNLEVITNNIATSQRNIITVIQEYSSFLDGFSTNVSNYAENRYNTLIRNVYILVIFASFLIFVGTLAMTRTIIKRIKNLQKVSRSLLQKDLTVQAEIKGKDEVAELANDINTTIKELESVIQQAKQASKDATNSGDTIKSSATQTAAATHEINSNIESLRKQFNKLDTSVENSIQNLMKMSDVAITLVVDNQTQSAAIEDNTKDIREITKTIQQISLTTSQRTESAKEIQAYVVDGDEKINATTEVLGEVTSKLDEIGEIVGIINAIAEQTNILSMNAAIESAHAGEAGRGFAVVAEEIRGLAESTGENAKRISASISGIVEKVNSADKASSLAAEAFTKVGHQTHSIIDSLKNITNDIQQVEKKIFIVDNRTNDIHDSATKISNHCDTFTQEQNTVSESMALMHNIFSEAKTGVEEIAAGSSDIVNRTLEVTEYSNITCDKMASLASTMEAFITNKKETEEPLVTLEKEQIDDNAETEEEILEEPIVQVDSEDKANDMNLLNTEEKTEIKIEADEDNFADLLENL